MIPAENPNEIKSLIFAYDHRLVHLGPLFTWLNFNSSMDNLSNAQLNVELNYLSISKLQRLNSWNFGIGK